MKAIIIILGILSIYYVIRISFHVIHRKWRYLRKNILYMDDILWYYNKYVSHCHTKRENVFRKTRIVIEIMVETICDIICDLDKYYMKEP